MKKYITPSMDIVEVEAACLLAGSGKEVNNSLGDDTPNDVTFHSREFSVWGTDDAQ